jgi:hypothetical protein
MNDVVAALQDLSGIMERLGVSDRLDDALRRSDEAT